MMQRANLTRLQRETNYGDLMWNIYSELNFAINSMNYGAFSMAEASKTEVIDLFVRCVISNN